MSFQLREESNWLVEVARQLPDKNRAAMMDNFGSTVVIVTQLSDCKEELSC